MTLCPSVCQQHLIMCLVKSNPAQFVFFFKKKKHIFNLLLGFPVTTSYFLYIKIVFLASILNLRCCSQDVLNAQKRSERSRCVPCPLFSSPVSSICLNPLHTTVTQNKVLPPLERPSRRSGGQMGNPISECFAVGRVDY